MEELIIEVTPEGNIKFETIGKKGDTCMKELDEYRKFLAAAGIETAIRNQKKKPEFYEKAGQRTRIDTGRK